MASIIVCALIVLLISVVSELRIMMLERIHKEYVGKAKQVNAEMYETAQEALSYVDATWSLLIDRMEQGEDVEKLIENKRAELRKGAMKDEEA